MNKYIKQCDICTCIFRRDFLHEMRLVGAENRLIRLLPNMHRMILNCINPGCILDYVVQDSVLMPSELQILP